MTRWAMVIDLNRCIGCKACLIACSQNNATPEGFWRKLHVLPETPEPERIRHTVTRSCMHCETPSCLSVCPTGATFKRADGIVDIDAEKCVGCGYCILACPYDARTIYRNHHRFEVVAISEHPDHSKEEKNREGICTKCNFCVTRIDEGLKKNLHPGIDQEATPHCVLTCSGGALHFGDLDDPQSEVSKMLKKNKVLDISSQKENCPSVYYVDVQPEGHLS